MERFIDVNGSSQDHKSQLKPSFLRVCCSGDYPLSGTNEEHRGTTSLNAQLAGLASKSFFMHSSRNLRQPTWLFIDKEFVECLIVISVNVCPKTICLKF